ncbi:MAG: hypothetical protein R6V57_17960, partial [Vicinamibacterales bacterium]
MAHYRRERVMSPYLMVRPRDDPRTADGVHLPLLAALAASGVLVLVYMVLGGFVAVAYNDVVRAVIMIIGLIALPALGLYEAGG